ncbi:Ribosome-binding protein 1 [Babesia ovata]|uniref:Ribosome-binding protein 1 n=1 Tax=Babesia ovata TaxID=189622 RepID=A0A2H6K991_9APIC|nr:Ribosome-binding protein 1 [Babesia ovata]GBE59550.1 Ribosome-binding protein 1 [Babesia ovata]
MMVESGNRFFFTTLRDCFVFFDWLYTEPEGKKTHEDVAKKLYGLLRDYYDGSELTEGKIKSNLTNFLSKVDTFYKKMVSQHVPEEALGTAAPIKKGATPEEIVYALLECLPKFLAAIYYLWYCVSYTFESLGGGGWKGNYPGWENDRWWGLRYNWGGDLQDYLRAQKRDADRYGGLIPGGFNRYEVRDGWSYNGYSHGYSMVTDLKTIFEKNDDTAKNLFRDVFATSVLTTTSGTQISNTANALALVNLFCEIVVDEDENGNGDEFKTHVQLKNGCVHWDFLKHHCSTLKSQLGKIFNDKAFSFTGYGRKRGELNQEKFAEKTADWLRSNLEKVRKNLEHIKSFESEHDYYAHEFSTFRKHHTMLQEYYAALGPYFTKNLFPYGFTFYGGKEHFKTNAPFEDFRAEWDGVIFELRRKNGGLAELKSIMDGKGCRAPRPPPKPRPRPAPAPRPPRPARPAPPPRPSRAYAGRTTGPRSLGDWSSVGTHDSGARGGGARGTGTNHRGGGSGAQGSRGRGAGPGGTSGAKSTQKTRAPGRPMSSNPQPLQSQNDSQRHSQQQTPAPAPSPPRVPDPPAKQLPTPARLTSQAPAPAHSSASSSSSSSSSVNGTGGPGLGPQAAAYGHSQQSVERSMGSTLTLPHASSVLDPDKQRGPSQGSMQPGTSDPLSSGSTHSGGVASARHSPKLIPVSQENKDVGMGIVGQPSHTLPSSPGAGEGSGAGGVPSTGGHSADSITRTAVPVASLSIDLPQTSSDPGQNSLSHGAAGEADLGSPGSSLPQVKSSHDGAPGPVDTPVDLIPDPDSKASQTIHPGLSSNARQAQNSNVQNPDPLSSRDHHDTAQDPKGQTHSSTQDISRQSSDVGSAHQGTSVVENQLSAANRAGPGGDDAIGGGGVAAGGTEGDLHVNVHSGKSSKASQPSMQHPTPTHSDQDPPSDIPGPPGGLSVTVQSSSQVNPQSHTGDASDNVQASIPQPLGPDPPGDSDDTVTRAQQIVPTRDNGPLSHPGTMLPVPQPPPPPSAPPTTKAAEPGGLPSTLHGLMKSQDLQDPPVMQTPDPSLIGDRDPAGPLNQPTSSSPTTAHGHPGKSGSGAPDPMSGILQTPQPDDIHGAMLTQPSSVSGSRPSLTAVSPSGGGKDPDVQASLSDPDLPHATLSMAIPGALPATSPVPQPGQKMGGDAGSGSPGATISDPHSQNGQTIDNNFRSSGASMNSGSDTSDQLPPQTSIPDPAEFQLEIEKLYTPEIIYGADKIQAERLPEVGYKRIVPPSDAYSNIPSHPPLHETFSPESLEFSTEDLCLPPWIANTHNYNMQYFPDTELFPSQAPCTVRDMLIWVVGLQNPKHIDIMKRCIEKVFRSMTDVIHGEVKLSVNGSHIAAKQVLHILKLAAMFAASVLSTIEPAWKGNATLSATLKPKVSDQAKDPDCCALLCQLRDYAYACHYQLQFLRSQCSRDQSHGGWQDCQYSHKVHDSPLQAFLTDKQDCAFETYLFDPCNICRKSRVNMGFKQDDLPATRETGNVILTILSPSCGGEDPLPTLCSYLTCLTRRTPRTTGELVSFFHNFGNSLHDAASQLSPLGSALSSPHYGCPEWDRLGAEDLQAVKDIRGSAPPNSNHHKDHPKTLSTLLGCGIDNVNCPQHMKPITYRAYALYSSTYVHHYLSWAVYLADRLWESLDRLSRDMKEHASTKAKPLHQCGKVLPLLYTHGFTPPEGMPSSQLTCSEVIVKLEAVLSGGPIASLMTAMDAFLYGVRRHFLYSLLILWSIATVFFTYTTLYRIDFLRICSHLVRSKASHLIDVKALLTKGRKMLSLYHDVDYFDDAVG